MWVSRLLPFPYQMCLTSVPTQQWNKKLMALQTQFHRSHQSTILSSTCFGHLILNRQRGLCTHLSVGKTRRTMHEENACNSSTRISNGKERNMPTHVWSCRQQEVQVLYWDTQSFVPFSADCDFPSLLSPIPLPASQQYINFKATTETESFSTNTAGISNRCLCEDWTFYAGEWLQMQSHKTILAWAVWILWRGFVCVWISLTAVCIQMEVIDGTELLGTNENQRG